MHASFSMVETYKNCQMRYKFSYIDKLTTIPSFDEADNAFNLGSCIHRAIETGNVNLAISEYFNQYPIIDDNHYTESMKMEAILKKVMSLIPNGKHEVPIKYSENDIDFVGFADLIAENGDLYDFKYSNNIKYYEMSPQLSVYKYFLNKLGVNIRDLYYFMIPKTTIKKMPDESIQVYRNKLLNEIKGMEPKIIKVEYNELKVRDFFNTLEEIKIKNETTKDYSKNERNCYFCGFKQYCKGETDYMILPKDEERDISAFLYHKFWIYGAPFTGKTTLASQLPHCLMLNTDGNIRFIKTPYISIKDEVTVNGRLVNRKLAWTVFKETLDELEKHENSFESIVIDLIEDIKEYCRVYVYDKLGITHESDAAFGKAYDMIKVEFFSAMKRFFNLPYKNLVIISHEDTSRDITKKSGQNITRIAPNIQQGFANKLAGMTDIVARIVAEDDGTSTINFKADEVIFGGGRLKGLSTTKIPLSWDAFAKVYDDAAKNIVNGKKPQVELNKPENKEVSRI